MLKVQTFFKKFKYNRGIIFLDGWKFIGKEPYTGDCDDYAWTVLVLTEGSIIKALLALLTFRAVFWLVKSPVNGIVPRHVSLWHKKYGWTDSSTKVWLPTATPNRKILPLLFPWVWFRVLWGKLIPLK